MTPVRADLTDQDRWLQNLDIAAFGQEVHELGQRLMRQEQSQGAAHLQLLEQMASWSDACAALGLATMWVAPNPFSVLMLGLWAHSRFTMVGHHSLHGGHNRIDPSGRYHSTKFGRNPLRRLLDWFDWFLPEAWGCEHEMHHFHLGELDDPDDIHNVSKTWGPKKWALTGLTLVMWNWGYIAPQTYKELKLKEWQMTGRPLPEGFDRRVPMTLLEAFRREGKNVFKVSDLICNVLLPYALFHFVVLPLPLAIVDPSLSYFWNAEQNLFMGDVLSSFLLFLCVATNHAGDDMYKFQRPCRPWSPTFYLRAVCGSTNFEHGGDLVNFLHGWTNHQIEHHCWPHLSMLSLSRGTPELKAICEKHGVPYVQESVWVRFRKTLEIMLEFSKMRTFPQAWEREADLLPAK